MSLPADRGHVRTEHPHAASSTLDELDTRQCLELMIADHQTVSAAVSAAVPDLVAFIDEVAARMAAGGRLIYLGAGTSGRLGVLDAAECPPTFQSSPGQVVGLIAGGDAALRQSSEGMEDDPGGAAVALSQLELTQRDTVVGITAGGTTPYVLGAFQLASEAGAATCLLTCAPLAQAPAHCDRLILFDTGPEILTGSTRLKAGSATKLALNMISTTVFIRLGKVYGNLMVDVRAINDKLADRALRILMALCPGLSRTDAAKVLLEAGGDLKLAIVMQRLAVDHRRAQALLQEHCGRLRPILARGRR